MTVTDFPDWAVTQDQASKIAATGVPLLRNELAITSGTTAALAPGASANASGGPFTVLSPSYDLTVTLTASAIGAIQNGQISLKWRDSTNTTLLAQKTFGVAASTGGHAITITGPVRGARLSITFTNASNSVPNITFAYTLVSSARLAPNDLMRTITTIGTGPPSNQTWSGTNNADSGILGNAAPSIATGGTAVRGLLAYNGPVQFAAVTASGANDLEVQIAGLDSTIFAQYGVVNDGFSDAHGTFNAQMVLPASQCQVTLVNHNAATKIVSFILTTQEPNVN